MTEILFDGGLPEDDLPARPLSCDDCGRFTSPKTAHRIHEYGDYGSILSTEVLCPDCGNGASQSEVVEVVVTGDSL